MSTLKSLVDEIILEAGNDALKIFYDIDVFLQEFKDADKKEPADVPVTPDTPPIAEPPTGAPPVAAPPVESKIEDETNQINEAIIKSKVKGELVVPKEDASNIQTLQDLVDYISDKTHSEKSIVEKVLNKKGSGKGKAIISSELQEIIIILAGAGDTSKLSDIVDIGDKVIINIDYGTGLQTSIGFKINKNSGTDSFSIMLKKDGKVLSGVFDQSILNRQILFYRNSLE